MLKNKINWKMFFILLGLSLFSVICVFPYVLTLQSGIIKELKISAGYLFVAQFVQSLILFSIAIYFGLFFTKKINFKLPLITAILEKGNYKKVLKNIWRKSALLGAAAALIIYGLDYIFTLGGATVSTHQYTAPVWQKLLAAFYGGTTEEILLRLFLMTFFIWLSMKISRKTRPAKAGIYVSIIFAAVIFGLGHLPITASLTEITPFVVLRAVVLNGVGGIIFGWLFWKSGLESAMIAHFTADIFLLTLLPLFIK